MATQEGNFSKQLKWIEGFAIDNVPEGTTGPSIRKKHGPFVALAVATIVFAGWFSI